MSRAKCTLIIFAFFALFTVNCGEGQCSSEDAAQGNCTNSYINKQSVSGTPVGVVPVESEPNDIFSDADTIIQTKQPDGSLNHLDNSFAIVGTFDTEIDEDWYRVNLNSADFDRLDANRTGCSTDGNDLATIQGNWAQCFSSVSGRPKPSGNTIPDHKELLSSNGHNFFKPRFVIRVESPDLSPIAVRVQVYPPTLGINFNGALTEQPIADSYLNIPDATNATEGVLRQIAAAGNLSLSFPSRWEHTVRVNDLDLNNLFYHGCYATSATTNPTAVKAKQTISYEQLVDKDLNAFLNSDPYNVGTYYVKISSSGAHKGKRYRIKWYWNTGRAIDGGVNEWTLTNSSLAREEISYSHKESDKQAEGATGDSAIPVQACNSGGTPYYNTTNPIRPYCDGAIVPSIDLTCNGGTASTQQVFCFNVRNITQDAASSEEIKKCAADGDRDGFITTKIGDIGCLFDSGACSALGGYNESRRYCDCWTSCGLGAVPKTANMVAGSNVMTNLATTTDLNIGYQITAGGGLPANTVITKILSTTSVELSNPSPSNQTGTSYTFNDKPVGCP